MEALNLYTKEVSLRERVLEILGELKMTKAELAIKIQYSRSAVSQYLGNKYNSNPAEIEAKLMEFVKAYEEQTGETGREGNAKGFAPIQAVKPKMEYFESRDFIQTIGVCKSCQENMALGIIVAKSGYGKTHALKKYARMPRVAYIECDDTMACRDLVEAIEIQIGMPKGAGGTIWSRVNRIRDFFNANEGYLLIIDEADKLINKYTQKKMEIIRGIFDQSDVGIVIAGEPRLEAEIKGNLARFANRMDFYYKLKGLSEQEVRDYLEGYDVEDAAMVEFISRAQNAQTGCFRLLDRTLNNVLRILKDSGQTRVTMKIVGQASNMMML
ncbi:MAG: AAA family ATPase [Roseburia sp.]|nr:AAA family ATPase [Roseburia sp.]